MINSKNEVRDLMNDPRGMKWHKFLIYFSLWCSAAINFLMSFIYLSYLGADHFNSYRYSFGSVLLTGVMAAAAGIYAIVTRFKLARFKENAPGHLTAYLILVLICNVVIGLTESSFSLYTVISSIVYIAINSTYYNKRRDLFIF